MKKLLLINPVGRRSGLLLSKISRFAPLGLAYVAAVTPPHWQVEIVDENITRCQFEQADLVGITSFTGTITRAYEIAAGYRKRRIPVIMGGIHVSMLPDEALRFADSVVIGEVEGVWGQIIGDFEQSRLARKYIGQQVDLSQYTIRPRRDLLHHGYLWNSVQTSRGCPFSCNFCSVSRYLGRAYRQRRVDDILDELSTIEGKYIAFVDDNLLGYSKESKERARALFDGMIKRGLNKKWWMQTSINVADDETAIKLAARAGCMFAFVGFETIHKGTLKEMRKGVNLEIGVENYRKVVDTFHKYGIAVLGAFVIGNDHEGPEYYERLAAFLVDSKIDMVQITILTPLPGTALMEQLQREERVVCGTYPEDWDKYRFSFVVHVPQGIDAEGIYRGNNLIKRRLYSFPTYHFRMVKSFCALRNLSNFVVSYKFNQALKKGWRSSHYYAD